MHLHIDRIYLFMFYFSQNETCIAFGAAVGSIIKIQFKNQLSLTCMAPLKKCQNCKLIITIKQVFGRQNILDQGNNE